MDKLNTTEKTVLIVLLLSFFVLLTFRFFQEKAGKVDVEIIRPPGRSDVLRID